MNLPPYVLDFEARVEKAIRKLAGSLPEGARVLDAGAGEARHSHVFTPRHRYLGVDLAVGDASWDYRRLDAIADLAALPFRDSSFDAALNIVTLEHVRDPALVMREIGRVLKPGAALLLAVPLEWEVHQSPNDYFRFTRHGIEHLLEQAGLCAVSIEPAGGIFRVLSRRMLSAIKVTRLAALLAPIALLLPLLDFLDRRRDSTLGYICWARRR